MSEESASARSVLDAIDPEEVAALAVELGAIESPTGAEGPAADRVEEWLGEEGLAPRRVGLVHDRPAIVSRLRGTGAGRDLVFNAHLDTAISRDDWLVYRDPTQPRYISAWREDDVLYGNGLVNDKGPMAAFLVAAATIHRLGIRLAGDIVLCAVPGEIGLEPMDELTGTAHLGKDLGTRFTIAHGAVGDGALVAEATGNTIGWVMAGKAYFRITVLGSEPIYTPFIDPEPDMSGHPSSVVRSAVVIQAINEWSVEYAQRVFDCEGGTVAPRANIGAMRSGRIDRITESTEVAFLYLDVRLRPDDSVSPIRRELEAVLKSTGVPCEVDCVLYRRGFEAKGIEPLREALVTAHLREFGASPPSPSPQITSMWRDINPYNEAGIPSLTYGPSASTGTGNFSLTVGDLAATARVYAETALSYCGPA